MLYNPVSHHPFVNYDDDRYVTDNSHVQNGLRWDTVKWAFTTYDEANWHPLTWLSHALDCQLFGLNPAGHHYVNVILHAVNVVLLFWVLWRATGATWRSLMVTALFALHPINVESVAWVAERKNVLSMLFFLLALGAYTRYGRNPSRARYLDVAIWFACGLMAKPMVITLPFVLLLWDYWPLRRISGANADQTLVTHSFWWLVLEKSPLILLAAISALVTVKAQSAGDAVRSVVQYPVSIRLENAAVAYVKYLGKAFWPSSLAPFYPHPGNSLKLWQGLAAAAILVAITLLIAAARQQRSLMVGWLWFFGTLVPMIGLVQVGSQAMADRYAYLPFVGLFIMVCWGVGDWAAARQVSTTWLTVAAVICLLVLGIVTHRQIGFWSDNLTLWSHTAQVTGNNFVAEDNIGGALLEQGRVDEAVIHFRTAAAINPADPMSRLNLGADELRRGNASRAIEQLTDLLQMTNDTRVRARACSDLGYAYRRLGDLVRAKQSFQAAVSARPGAFRAWLGLGLIAQKSGDYAEAVNDYSAVVTIQPWDLGYFLLARALQQSGRTAESEAALQQARRLSANFDNLTPVADALLK